MTISDALYINCCVLVLPTLAVHEIEFIDFIFQIRCVSVSARKELQNSNGIFYLVQSYYPRLAEMSFSAPYNPKNIHINHTHKRELESGEWLTAEISQGIRYKSKVINHS